MRWWGESCRQREGHVLRFRDRSMRLGDLTVFGVARAEADLPPERWKATESFRQRRGVIRSGLEHSLWLERGEMTGGMHPEVTVAWPKE